MDTDNEGMQFAALDIGSIRNIMPDNCYVSLIKSAQGTCGKDKGDNINPFLTGAAAGWITFLQYINTDYDERAKAIANFIARIIQDGLPEAATRQLFEMYTMKDPATLAKDEKLLVLNTVGLLYSKLVTDSQAEVSRILEKHEVKKKEMH
jgi:hypothetical protein